MPDAEGLLFALALDGRGGAEEVDAVEAATVSDRAVWIHLDRTSESAQDWLEKTDLDPVIAEALFAEETRPRCTHTLGGLLLVLRGANLNPGADPEDLVSLRIWVDKDKLITVRSRKLMTIVDVRAELLARRGPVDTSGLLASLVDTLTTKLEDVVGSLDGELASIDDELQSADPAAIRKRLAGFRRELVALRRYIAPQRDALSRLHIQDVGWLNPMDRARLRETADRTVRHVEELDESRERAALAKEELASRLAEQLNTRMYALSIVAAVFLPLGLLTGLLGINVAGIPGAEQPVAFAAVCGLLLVVVVLQLLLYRRLKWL